MKGFPTFFVPRHATCTRITKKRGGGKKKRNSLEMLLKYLGNIFLGQKMTSSYYLYSFYILIYCAFITRELQTPR